MKDPVKLARRRASGRMSAKNPNERFRHYKKNAKTRNIKFYLTKDEFMTFWNKNCSYCGDEIEGIGIDRVDNLKGYILSNCVSACKHCNRMKMSMNVKQFIDYCKSGDMRMHTQDKKEYLNRSKKINEYVI